MGDLLSEYLLALLFFVFLLSCSQLYKAAIRHELFKRISWVFNDSSAQCFDIYGNLIYGTDNLESALFSKTGIITGEEAFRLSQTSDEMEHLRIILAEHKEYLAHAFFRKQLKFPFSFRGMDECDYYFLSLRSFLSSYESTRPFCHRSGCELYEPVGGSTYRLTPFGTVFIKLKYHVSLYCIQNASTNLSHEALSSVEYLREQLYTGIAEFQRIRL